MNNEDRLSIKTLLATWLAAVLPQKSTQAEEHEANKGPPTWLRGQSIARQVTANPGPYTNGKPRLTMVGASCVEHSLISLRESRHERVRSGGEGGRSPRRS